MAPLMRFIVLQLCAAVALATRFIATPAQETPFIPGYFAQEAPIPKPTSPPQVIRNLVPRDRATCGYLIKNGKANVCGENQYCFTTANGEFGEWNCCNPSSCFTQTACSYSSECGGDKPYCVTSFMSHEGTTYSRFMCGTTSSIVFMAYKSEDTPQYTQSLQSASSASAASASAASASDASARSQSAADASSTPPSVSTSIPIGSSSPLIPTDDEDSGLSAGGIAGAVVGSVVGIALIGALAFFFWRARQKKDAGNMHEVSGTAIYPPVEQYKPVNQYAHVDSPSELPPNQYHELPPEGVNPQPSELGSYR
ncbi:hypothetical protein CC78DRAFT_582693 [Lojkania enalia]|uniref:Mid2 domain-containing protein n=1 Tax=Lojkania enalia TaxID=147567 RepID=A0A9P4N7L7_9PLEO|nr:hypothetical protein CC78DRAFT_582693 [Didymosphaeria enalia]